MNEIYVNHDQYGFGKAKSPVREGLFQELQQANPNEKIKVVFDGQEKVVKISELMLHSIFRNTVGLVKN